MTPCCVQVKEARKLRVVSVSEKEERRQRPHGLNTVEMLKVGGGSRAATRISE
jgi:DNA topoisomerase-3